MKELWQRFIKDESGQGLVEYILIIAVVAILIIAALAYFRGTVGNTYNGVADIISTIPASS